MPETWAKVVAICISTDRQKPKTSLPEALFVESKGIDGDSHFGMGERQISLMRYEDIRQAEKEAGFVFPPGALAENLLIKGLPEELLPGQTLSIAGNVTLVVVEKGKRPDEPHSYEYRGWCLLPTKGYFLSVEKGGTVAPNDEVLLK